jgi:hypothetical protein
MPTHLPPIDMLNQGIHNAPDEDNICLICHDALILEEEHEDNNTPYTLECKHRYHANCIITWFRSGHMNCPYCGDNGVNAPKEYKTTASTRTRRSWWSPHRQIIDARYQRLRQYARRKDAPTELVRLIDKLKVFESDHENYATELNEFKDRKHDGITWNDLGKERDRLRIKKWTIYKKIEQQKRVISTYPVIPLIIPRIIA